MKTLEEVLAEIHREERTFWFRAKRCLFIAPYQRAAFKRFVKRTVTGRWLRMVIQRARRGWAEEDVWSLDFYIAQLLSGALLNLAKDGHTYPGEGTEFDTPEKWKSFLEDLSARLGAWDDDAFLDDEAFDTAKSAMLDFARAFGHLWS